MSSRPTARSLAAADIGEADTAAATRKPDLGVSSSSAWARRAERWWLEHGVLHRGASLRRSFSVDDRELVQVAARARRHSRSENVDLHHQVQRQAVTDELTGLANHGRFQALLNAEIEQVRRYHHSIGLIMLDIDDFKAVNDTYGHQQGDLVLKHVARIVRENSRDADSPARYGGEEMALVLPHTDLEGSHAIAERVRAAIEALRISRLDGQGTLRITASVGVTASSEGDKDGLIGEADGALYEAKRTGKETGQSGPPRELRTYPDPSSLWAWVYSMTLYAST